MRMKKIMSIIAALLVGVVSAFSAEGFVFAPGDASGLHFILLTNVYNQATWTYTNGVIEPWQPVRIQFFSSYPSTVAVHQVVVNRRDWYLESSTNTDGFGNIQTNYFHALTNTTYNYFTNTLGTVTNAAGTQVSLVLSDDYFQKGDFLRMVIDNTNSLWIRITATR
jgi:hypothetical protein